MGGRDGWSRRPKATSTSASRRLPHISLRFVAILASLLASDLRRFQTRLATDTKISGVSVGTGVGVEISIPKKVGVGVGVSSSDTKNSGVSFLTLKIVVSVFLTLKIVVSVFLTLKIVESVSAFPTPTPKQYFLRFERKKSK